MRNFLFIFFVSWFCIMIMFSLNSSLAQTIGNTPIENPPTFFSLNFFYKPLFIANDRNLHLSLNSGFLKYKRFTIGPIVNLVFFKNENFGVLEYNKFSVGPFIRYYFNQRIFSPFIESSLCFGGSYLKQKDNVLQKRELLELSLIPGASVKLNAKLYVDVQFKIFYNVNKPPVNDPNERLQLIPLLGVHYRFSNDKNFQNN